MANELVLRNGLIILGTLGSGTGDPLLTLDAVSKEVGSIPPIDLSTYLTNSLTSAYIYVGNGSDVATGVSLTGAISITNTGVASLAPGIVTNTEVASTAAIAYSKLNLALGIVNGDISTSASIALSKLATGNTYRLLANNNLGVPSEVGAITASRLLQSNANGIPEASTITTTIAGYLDPTSSVQTQLNNRLSFSSAITPVNGDVLYYTSGAWSNLPIGSDGDVLTLASGLPSWATVSLSGLLPTGGTTNQYLRKVDGTDYNTTWDTLNLSDITDITANITQINALATGFYDATSSVQTQINAKLSTSLATNNLYVGVAGVATATTDLPTATTIGSQYIYRTGGTTITVSDGGTGLASYAVGDLIYASGATTLAKKAAVATGSVLGSAGVTTAPAYLTVSNGLTATATTFKLGGALTADTNISGAFLLGLNIAPTAKLHIHGTGATSATSALLVENSAGSKLFEILNDGPARYGNAGSRPSIGSGTTSGFDLSGQSMYYNGIANISHIFATSMDTSSTANGIRLAGSWTGSSGAGNGAGLLINTTLNGTGSQSGSWTGIQYNPTITSILGIHYGIVSVPTAALSGVGTSTPIASWHISGSQALKTSTSSAASLTLDKTVSVYIFTGSSGTTWTLPAITGNTDLSYYIKNRGSANIILQRAGSDNIYDTASVTSITILPGEARTVVNDGAFWNIL